MEDNRTSDMYLASTLIAYGGEIEDVDKHDERRQVFIFRSLPSFVWVINEEYVTKQVVKGIAEIKSLMIAGKLLFPPNFITAIKSIKSYIYTE